jgi:hypothetical protein
MTLFHTGLFTMDLVSAPHLARGGSGPSKMWVKAKNPASEAARRESEEEWR